MSIFAAIVAAIRAIPIIDGWVVQLISVYIDSAKASAKKDLIDAASASASAKTDEDRIKALGLWQKALTNTRYE